MLFDNINLYLILEQNNPHLAELDLSLWQSFCHIRTFDAGNFQLYQLKNNIFVGNICEELSSQQTSLSLSQHKAFEIKDCPSEITYHNRLEDWFYILSHMIHRVHL